MIPACQFNLRTTKKNFKLYVSRKIEPEKQSRAMVAVNNQSCAHCWKNPKVEAAEVEVDLEEV